MDIQAMVERMAADYLSFTGNPVEGDITEVIISGEYIHVRWVGNDKKQNKQLIHQLALMAWIYDRAVIDPVE